MQYWSARPQTETAFCQRVAADFRPIEVVGKGLNRGSSRVARAWNERLPDIWLRPLLEGERESIARYRYRPPFDFRHRLQRNWRLNPGPGPDSMRRC